MQESQLTKKLSYSYIQSDYNEIIHLLLTGSREFGHFELLTLVNEKRHQQKTRKPPRRALPGKPATNEGGLSRERMTWTKYMNYTVMQCYFRATQFETIAT